MNDFKQSACLALLSALTSLVPYKVKLGLKRASGLYRLVQWLLAAVAPPGLTEVVVTGGILRGARMALNLKKEKYYWLGTYEPQVQYAISERIHAGMTVYDVGAHLGFFALACSRLVGSSGRVFAFEPLHANYERIMRNKQLNCADNLSVIAAAVAERTGEAVLNCGGTTSMASLEPAGATCQDPSEAAIIDTVSLDDFVNLLGHPAPDWVKIDVEGAEGRVLAGMADLLRRHPPYMIIEIHNAESAAAVWAILNEAGYRLSPLEKPHEFAREARDLFGARPRHFLAEPVPSGRVFYGSVPAGGI